MKKKDLAEICCLVILFLGMNNEAKAKLWGVNIIGGGSVDSTYQEFYDTGKLTHEALTSFQVPNERLFEYFGQPKTHCYSQDPEESEAERKKEEFELNNFLKNTSDCSKLKPMAGKLLAPSADETQNQVCSEPPATHTKNLLNFDGGENPQIRGPASLQNTEDAFTQVIEKSQKNDHVYINFTDHGYRINNQSLFLLRMKLGFLLGSFKKPTGTSWYQDDVIVGLGDESEFLTNAYFRDVISSLAKKGVTVHLNIQSCFSGEFATLTKTAGQTPACVTTDSDSHSVSVRQFQFGTSVTPSFGSLFPTYVKKYGSQLNAFACALAQDFSNRPNSSIDSVIDNWEKPHSSVDLSECVLFKNITETEERIAAIAQDVNLALFRKELIEVYKSEFVDLLMKCSHDRSKWEKIAKGIASCASDKKVGVDPTLVNYVKEAWGGDIGEKYELAMLNRHMKFLLNADENSLKEFKTAFCCLAYNFKNNTSPSICKK